MNPNHDLGNTRTHSLPTFYEDVQSQKAVVELTGNLASSSPGLTGV